MDDHVIGSPPRSDRDDQGFTLVELLISAAIMSVVMAIVIGAVAQVYSASTRVDQTSYGRDQLTIAFRRLDKEIRYAEWIAKPAPVGTRYYVEYAVPGDGCRQLKFAAGTLTLYSWKLPSTTPAGPQILGNNLAMTAGVTNPFAVYFPDSTPYATASAGTAGVGRGYSPDHAILRVQMNVVFGRITMPFDTIFTAENTDRNTPTDNDCADGRPLT